MTKKNKRLRFLTSNWVITLTATLIGVFAALYLNEVVSSTKLKNQKSIATKNILIEVSSNNKKIKKATQKHIELLDIIQFLGKYADEENGKLIVPVDSMTNFQLKHPDKIDIKDSTIISDGIYDYKGELNFDFSTPQLEITTIAWKTLKSSGISSTYGFECLMYLEGLYNITDEVSIKNKELLDYFIGEKETGEKNENLIRHLHILIDFEKSIIKMYESSKKELKNCN